MNLDTIKDIKDLQGKFRGFKMNWRWLQHSKGNLGQSGWIKDTRGGGVLYSMKN